MSEPRTEHQDDPWKALYRALQDLLPTLVWVRFSRDLAAAQQAVDARHAEEIAAKDREVALHLAAMQCYADEQRRLRAELATLRAQLAAVQRVAKEWNEFAFTGEVDYVPVGDGCIAARCADQVEAIIAGKDPGDSLMAYTHDDIDERRKRNALSSPTTQEPQTPAGSIPVKEQNMSLSENESEIARCTLCGEPMPAGEEMFKFHGYSGPCPTPAPKPPQKATCETNGHIYGHEGVCMFCRTPKPTPEPQTVCEWRDISTAPKDETKIDVLAKAWLPAFDRFEFRRFPDAYWWEGVPMSNNKPQWMNVDRDWRPVAWMPIPPLQLSPESPNEGAK